jgi:hypothetical protein
VASWSVDDVARWLQVRTVGGDGPVLFPLWQARYAYDVAPWSVAKANTKPVAYLPLCYRA